MAASWLARLAPVVARVVAVVLVPGTAGSTPAATKLVPDITVILAVTKLVRSPGLINSRPPGRRPRPGCRPG
jgi:hypothetical protein